MSEELIEGQFGVEAKLAEAGADQVRRHSFEEAPEAAPSEGTPAEQVTERATERVRNERGQFAAREPEAEAPENAEEVSDDAPAVDPNIEKFLAKYGGDVDKALEGAVNLQKQAGQQSNELGELRQLVEQLAQHQIQQQNQPQPQYVDQGTVDWFDQKMYENPNQTIEWARQQGNAMLFQRGLDAWKEADPYSASVYTNELRNQQIRAEMEQKFQQQQQLPQDAQVNLALQNVRSRNPEFASLDDALEGTIQKYPYAAAALDAAANSGDPAQLEGAIETLYALARGDTLYSALRSGATPEDSTTTADVAVPTTSESREAPAPPSKTDQFKEAFRQEAERQNRGVWVAQ